MSRYLISSPHTEEDCIRAMDAMLSKGTSILDKFVFGCKEGDHTGYAIVEVKNMRDALAMVPDYLQEYACITKVDKFTAADLRSMHAKKAA